MNLKRSYQLRNDTKKPTRTATLIGLNFCIMYIDIYTCYGYNKGKRAICAKALPDRGYDPKFRISVTSTFADAAHREPCRITPVGFSFSVVVGVMIHQFIHNVNDDSVDSEKFSDI